MSSVVCRQFSLGEIEDATKNFEKILGHGGEAIVYLGKISAVGSVAVKRFKSNLLEFDEEIDLVSKIKHPHLVSLHGYCEESGQKILVYEYMGNGSLADYISKKRRSTICLSWQQRLNICLGAARGLQYLHKNTEKFPKGIIHRDIKPDNILLDDDWVAKVSDFGLCKLSHTDQIKSTMITQLKGTGGYYAPEYIKYGNITRKLDVYAFGVVLFQVLCCKTPWDRGDESYYRMEDEDLGLWARENVDPEINEEISEDCLEAFTHIIGRSLQTNPIIRPTMDDVVMDLDCALKCQDEGTHPKAPTRGGTVSIPSSVRKMIQNIKEMNIKEISENSEDEIYAMLKESSMDLMQTIQKLLKKARKSNETAAELPESSNTIHNAIATSGSSNRRQTSQRSIKENNSSSAVKFANFQLYDLEKATNNFDDARIIRRGEFGITYKGKLNKDDTVEVKRYNLDGDIDNKFRNELLQLSTFHHSNLVRIIGKCEDYKSQELILVHVFMENGTLADHLFGEGKGASLSWLQQLRIGIDIARGLEYLHHGFGGNERIVHRNLKPDNILLDEKWKARISEFGLVKLGNANEQNSAMKTDEKGTNKYLDPYYDQTGIITRKSDVYAFGVILFDILFGRKDFNGEVDQKQETLGQWTHQCLKDGRLDGIIDERLKGQILPESLKEFGELASSCVDDNPMSRPTMPEIVKRLKSILKTSPKTQP